MTWTDEELVARSIRGDADSFNELILRWERPIYALAYRTIGREEDARDVCQETFLRAFRALPGFRGQAKFSSWLYRIALNLCRDWMRRERRTPRRAAARGRRPDGARGRGGAVRVDRGSRRAQGPDARRRAGDGAAARRAAHGDRVEGISRAHVPGDCRSGRLSAEHGEDPVVSGTLSLAARAGEERRTQWCSEHDSTTCTYREPRRSDRRLSSTTSSTPSERDLFARTSARLRAIAATKWRSSPAFDEQLAAWTPPALESLVADSSRSPPPRSGRTCRHRIRSSAWWAIPVWAQVAAAMLCLGVGTGVGAGLADLRIHVRQPGTDDCDRPQRGARRRHAGGCRAGRARRDPRRARGARAAASFGDRCDPTAASPAAQPSAISRRSDEVMRRVRTLRPRQRAAPAARARAARGGSCARRAGAAAVRSRADRPHARRAAEQYGPRGAAGRSSC